MAARVGLMRLSCPSVSSSGVFVTHKVKRATLPTTSVIMYRDLERITLYTALTANGIKISIALEELSLEYKSVEVDIAANEQKEPWFLRINPNGRIPAITDNGQRVFESGAILLYLTEKYDQERMISYEPGSTQYYEQLSWLMFQMGGVGPMQGSSF